MKNKLTYAFSGIIIIMFISAGCRKFVEVPAPYTLTPSSTVFSSNASATAAQTAIYVQLLQGKFAYLLARRTGAYADELTNYSPNSPALNYYTNGITPGLFNDLWNTSYQGIYTANAVINGVQTSNNISVKVNAQLTGEAKFMRAFLNFNLVNLFGDIPLVTSTDYASNAILPRTATSEVYKQIIKDCQDGDNLMSPKFIDNTDTVVTTERIRPTKWAAEALLSRVYLYTGDYVNAEAMASSVIANTALFSLNAQLSQVFVKNSTESIWQIQNTSNYYFNSEGNNFTIAFGLSTFAENTSSAISPQLFNAFEAGDNRKTTWIAKYNNTYNYPNKYQTISFSGPFNQYSTVLRLAELYLIRAEARAQQGNTSGAVTDLNMIRNRAGLANYAGLTDKTSLLAAILHERQVELFTEYGHRWYDLKRMNQANAVMSIVTPLKGGTWDPFKLLWPIPSTDIPTDPKLTQNPGY